MQDKIRWAILGAGRIAHKFAQDFRHIKNAEIVGVASRDLSRAKAFAGQYAIPHVYSYQELYAGGNIDAVYIATPHNFHYEQSLSCLQNGKAVLCEKPITINDTEFKDLAATAKAKKVFLMEGLWTYFLPAIIKAKEWVSQGRIGELKIIHADFGYAMEYNPEGRLFNPLLAGGALLDLGIYPIAFATYFMGRKPDSIVATGTLTGTGVDATTNMLFQYGDVSGILFTSMLTRTINKGYIFGDKGYIEVPDFFKASSAYLYGKEKEAYNREYQLMETFEDKRAGFGYEFQIQHVTNSLLQGLLQSTVVPLSTSNDIQEIMTEVRRQTGLRYPMEKL